ncbi:MAG: glutamate racemase [Bacteroidales bacterium]|nr:glutamate racemase [Bacteroidales bacterium]
MSSIAPIGVFDSGFGGLTILKKIVELMPDYDYVFLGDNARAPYGSRSFATVYNYTLQAVKKLFDLGCPLVVLACNTASAKALRTIQQDYIAKYCPQNRVLGIIRPTAEMLGSITKTNKVGVLGTAGTVNSQSYILETAKLFPNIKVYQQACPLLVPIVENNEIDTPGADYFVKKYTDSLFAQDADIDTIVLGCTHYPLLINSFKKFLPAGVSIVKQNEIVAQSLRDYLCRHPEIDARLSKNSSIRYFTTDDSTLFNRSASVFMGRNVESESIALAGCM